MKVDEKVVTEPANVGGHPRLAMHKSPHGLKEGAKPRVQKYHGSAAPKPKFNAAKAKAKRKAQAKARRARR